MLVQPASLDRISSESEVCIHVISEDFQLQIKWWRTNQALRGDKESMHAG